MLNYETILSNYDDKLTLMQWLKKVEAALNDASATNFEVVKRGDATISFKITFADGTAIESGDIVLQQGESVTGAAIVNGHLILTLSNGDTLDAGSIFNGNVNINGSVSTTGNITAQGSITAQGQISGASIVETMTGYTCDATVKDNDINLLYVGIVKNGNKLTIALFVEVTPQSVNRTANICRFTIPNNVNEKLVTYSLGGANTLDNKLINCFDNVGNAVEIPYRLGKGGGAYGALYPSVYLPNTLTLNTTYIVRVESTFLLSDSMA